MVTREWELDDAGSIIATRAHCVQYMIASAVELHEMYTYRIAASCRYQPADRATALAAALGGARAADPRPAARRTALAPCTMAPLLALHQLALLLLSSRRLPTAHAYGEGLFTTLPERTGRPQPLSSPHPSLVFVGDEAEAASPKLRLHCRHEPLGRADAIAPVPARLLGRLPGAKLGSYRCLDVVVRSDSSRNWWYLVPPAPTNDATAQHCGVLTPGRDGVPALDISLGHLKLSAGYSLLSAELDDAIYEEPATGSSNATAISYSGEPPLHAHASVWVAPKSAPEDDSNAVDLAKERDLLAEAHAVVRKDEEEDRHGRRQNVFFNAREYDNQRLHPRLTLRSSFERLADLLDPELSHALQNASKESIWSIVRGSDHTTRCRGTVAVDEDGEPLAGSSHAKQAACASGVCKAHEQSPIACDSWACFERLLAITDTVPVFKPQVGVDLIEEILHAKGSSVGPGLSMPNNGQDKRTARTGVILDEIGLGELARSLAAEVLEPVAQVTHPVRGRPQAIYGCLRFPIKLGFRDGTGVRVETGMRS